MTLTWYLTRIALARIALALVGLVALALAITLLDAAPALLRDGGAGAVALFSALRATLLADEMAGVAVLIGATLSFATLAGRNEMTALRAAGMSAPRLLLRLTPLAAALALAGHLLADRAAPAAETALARAFPGVAAPTPASAPVWAPLGRETARFTIEDAANGQDSARLTALTVFTFDAAGRIVSRLDAASAQWRDGRWLLSAPTRADAQGLRPAPDAEWLTPLDPAAARTLALRPERVSGEQARAGLSGDAPAMRAPAFLRTRVAAAWADALTPACLVCFAVLAGFGPPRAGQGRLAALSLALGFVYLALDGALANLGASGALSPVAAAFAPKAIGGAVALWAVLMVEG